MTICVPSPGEVGHDDPFGSVPMVPECPTVPAIWDARVTRVSTWRKDVAADALVMSGGPDGRNPMVRSSLRLRQRHVAHLAVALAISVTTIPVVLGALTESAEAATTSVNSPISTQQVIADVECDIAWADYDAAYLEGSLKTPPSCTPVPVGIQQSFATVEYDLCIFELYTNGGHGFCIPPAS